MKIYRSDERGLSDYGWLRSKHSFSFAHFYSPTFNGLRALRVINEDTVAPGRGFDTHSHRDMEIISYVINGAITHEDSMGFKSVLRPGEVQVMSAGTGVSHSEYNKSQSEELHFLQIWIFPRATGLSPRYQSAKIGEKKFSHLVSDMKGKGLVTLNQDVNIYMLKLEQGETQALEMNPQRYAWFQLISGKAAIGDQALGGGDGLYGRQNLSTGLVTALTENTHLLYFDLA